MSRASSYFGVVVAISLSLVPFFGVVAGGLLVHGQEKGAKQRQEPEDERERLRAEQLEALQDTVWYATRLLWGILIALAALILGMVLKSTQLKPARKFDPARDRKKPIVNDANELES